MTPDTFAQVRKSSESAALTKLSRMLRSMLRRFPQARLWTFQAGFGVSLDAQTYVRVSYNGNWSTEDMRDLHALFATWLVADPERLRSIGAPLSGALQGAQREYVQSSGAQD